VAQNQIDQPRTSSARPWDLTFKTKQANDRKLADKQHRDQLLQEFAEALPEALPLVAQIPDIIDHVDALENWRDFVNEWAGDVNRELEELRAEIAALKNTT
jgi:hypothetical protein